MREKSRFIWSGVQVRLVTRVMASDFPMQHDISAQRIVYLAAWSVRHLTEYKYNQITAASAVSRGYECRAVMREFEEPRWKSNAMLRAVHFLAEPCHIDAFRGNSLPNI